ncbi:MAG TPA: hypothetical protein VM261_06135 [Kofleriaceae bacterium]|nr:hypothetical protein [Kofleriaceae bacterium]
MTQVQRDGHRMLVLRFGGASYALSAGDLAAIDQDGASARIAVDGPVQDLADMLPHATPAAEPVRLIVSAPGTGDGGTRRRAFRAAASLELVDASTLYRLPRFLRGAGCAPWIRGVALLEQPTVWIDLARLAAAS